MVRTKVMFAAAALAVTVAAVTGCGGGISPEDARAKLAELAAKGVPESEMATVRRHIANVEGAKRIGNTRELGVQRDSLTAALPAFEAEMLKRLEAAGPIKDSIRKVCEEKIAGLKGLHLAEAEKGKKLVDSLIPIEKEKLNAQSELERWSLRLDTLIDLQRIADSLRRQFVGIWVMEEASEDPNYRGSKRTEIRIGPDSSVIWVESQKFTSPRGELTEARYENYGKWDLLGDVAYHKISREKRIHHNDRYFDDSGKLVTKTQPKFDSTFAPGTRPDKDRVAPWVSINKDYKRFPYRK